jgi:hypothetical protein
MEEDRRRWRGAELDDSEEYGFGKCMMMIMHACIYSSIAMRRFSLGTARQALFCYLHPFERGFAVLVFGT